MAVILNFFETHEFNRENVCLFFESLEGKRHNTLNNFLKILKHVVRFRGEKWLDDFTYFKKQPYHVEVLLPQEIKALAECQTKRPIAQNEHNVFYRTLIYTLALTGMRIGEIINLKWEDVKTDRIIVRESKTDTERTTPITDWLYGLIYALPSNDYVFGRRGGQLDKGKVNAELKTRARMCKIHKRVYCHVFRHSLATQLIKDGHSIEIVARILGHSIATCDKYYSHIQNEAMLEVIKCHPLLQSEITFKEVREQLRKVYDRLGAANCHLKLYDKGNSILLEALDV